jgi:hypothetical protein
MSSIPRLGIEKRAESFGKRREHHVDREPRSHRFAGELFGLELKDRERRQEKQSRSRLQSSRPVGIGFGEKDNYGPDDSWDTKDPIKGTPVPSYYNVPKTF